MSREIRAQNTQSLTSVKAINDAAQQAETDAAAAAVAAENAATSAENAATSASNAATSASNAATSASNAAADANSAGRSASAAQAASEAAQAAALSSLTTDTLHYLATSAGSGVTRSTPGWTTTVQAMTPTNKYLWTYHTYTAANGTTTDSDPIITGVYGEQGATGAQGVSVSSVQPQYYLSDSASETTGGSWSNSLTYVAGKYIWTRDAITYSNSTTGYSTAIYNGALTDACKDAAQALGLIEDQQDWFWHDANGAHVLGAVSGYRTDIKGSGMEIVDTSQSGTPVVAKFAADGAQIGQNASGKTRTEVGSNGMQIVQNDGGSDTQIANLGYGPGNSQGGTADAPYYTFGTRANGSTNGNYSVAEGISARASGYASHAGGYWSKADGYYSFAEGDSCFAAGQSSHAQNDSTQALGARQTAIGVLNVPDADVDYFTANGTSRVFYLTNITASNTSNIKVYINGEIYKKSFSVSFNQNSVTLSTTPQQGDEVMIADIHDEYAFIIGNGNWQGRSNAFAVKWDGEVEIDLGSNKYTGDCSTAASTAAKVVTATDGPTELTDGDVIVVKMTNANTASSPTLNVNSLGAKSIYKNGSAAGSGAWSAGDVVSFKYNSTNTRYDILADGDDVDADIINSLVALGWTDCIE